MNNKLLDIVIIVLLVLIFLFSILTWVSTRGTKEEKLSTLIGYASRLRDSGLYNQAIGTYEKLLEKGKLDREKAENIIYTIGTIYMDDLRDYSNALAQFLKLRELYPKSHLLSDVQKRIVTCLEHTGESAQAQRELERATSVEKTEDIRPGDVVVAELGKRRISLRELDKAYNNLPEQMKKQFAGRTGKKQFLSSYVAQELVYEAAVRAGLEQEPEVAETIENIKKQILLQEYYKRNIGKEIKPTESDLRLYYDAHKDEFEGKSFNEVKATVNQLYAEEKLKEKEQELLSKMLQSQDVKIYPDSVR
ncbi:MAG: hypothetical protein B6D65_06100 [candidate division Zixibacteria bacterium 4484_93]|nr:MAG: hypothetical protein B6D65_06100 [candidate division Zixibacteria bacterium 4484_93]